MGRTRCGSWCIKAAVRNLAAWMIFRKVTVEQFVAILADAPTGETAEKMKRDLAKYVAVM